jgi:hypothetical protein
MGAGLDGLGSCASSDCQRQATTMSAASMIDFVFMGNLSFVKNWFS